MLRRLNPSCHQSHDPSKSSIEWLYLNVNASNKVAMPSYEVMLIGNDPKISISRIRCSNIMNESDHSPKDGYALVYITSSQISTTDKKGMPQYKVVHPNQQLPRGTML